MLEIIHAATGGGVGVTLIWALIKHPQALAAILALVVAPFPGKRTYGRYKEMVTLLSAGEAPAKETSRKKSKHGR
jgi:hypothetical protein